MPWEALWTIAFVPVFWMVMCLVVAQVSGWSRLAARFPASFEPFDGTRFRWQFLGIGACDYNGCVTLRASPEGLFIAVWPIFFGHPVLLIPWSEMRVLEERRFLGFHVAKVEVGSPPLAILKLPVKVVDAGRNWLRVSEESS